MPITLDHLRRHAIARSLFPPTTLGRAIDKLGFLQADPIRAPARAQDLTLRHRVRDYRAGDLESRYPRLGIEEDFFVNYGFVTRELHRLMHPRQPRTAWAPSRWAQAQEVQAFASQRRFVHPREVDAQFQHGKTRNWFGGSSNASTELLDGMHYRGLLRVARREGGTRCYAAHDAHRPREALDAIDPAAALDAMVDVIVAKYAPLPMPSFSWLVMRLAAAAPQWRAQRAAALARAKARLPQARIDGQLWVWPAGEDPRSRRHRVDDAVRLLAPFDPIVWDRRRFEAFWAWPYRFEAYTPAPKRQLGYYALPILWCEQVVGWANVGVREGRLEPAVGFFGPRIADPAFTTALDDELQRLHTFLDLG